MKFERRDIILIVGLILFMIGLMPFTTPIYAVIIVTLMYFGIKFYVGKRRKSIIDEVGEEGICMECGSKIQNKKCPQSHNHSKYSVHRSMIEYVDGNTSPDQFGGTTNVGAGASKRAASRIASASSSSARPNGRGRMTRS